MTAHLHSELMPANTRHEITFLFRDTAGQERYETLTKQYYRRAQVGSRFRFLFPLRSLAGMPNTTISVASEYLVSTCLLQGIFLVYDICNEKTFEGLQKWMDYLREVNISTLQAISPPHTSANSTPPPPAAT